MTNPANIYILYGSKIVLRKNILKKNKGDKTMKKVLLTSAVALAAFGAVQAVSAEDTTNSRFGSQFDKYRQPNAEPDHSHDAISADNSTAHNRFGYGFATGAKYIRYDRDAAHGFNRRVRVTVVDGGGRPVPNVEVDFFLKPASGEKKPEYFTATTNQSGDAELPTVFKAGEVIQYRVAKTATDFKEAVELVDEFVVEGGNEYAGSLFTNRTITLPYKLDDRAAKIGNPTAAAQYGWAKTAEGWKYFENAKAVSGWKQVDGNWYYLNDKGVMQTGWVNVNGTWYYLNKSGAMQTGWLKDGETWYFLESTGAMKASQWFEVSGKWYHVNGSGALSVNTTVDGYNVNANGEWV